MGPSGRTECPIWCGPVGVQRTATHGPDVPPRRAVISCSSRDTSAVLCGDGSRDRRHVNSLRRIDVSACQRYRHASLQNRRGRPPADAGNWSPH